MTSTEAAYRGFGTCPDCDSYDGYINIGRSHWFYCAEHKTKWLAGHNLFDSWRDQTREEQERIYDEVGFGAFAYVADTEEEARAYDENRGELPRLDHRPARLREPAGSKDGAVTTTGEHHHEWDGAIDSGGGWTDQLVSQYNGQAVFATRNIASYEEQTETMRLVFPDGSRLYVGVDGWPAVKHALDSGQAQQWTDVPHTDAMRVFGQQWVKPLYDDASIKQLDTDL